MPSPGKDGLFVLIRAFIHHRTVNNYAPKSTALAESHLWDFALYCEDRGIADPRALTKDDILAYLSFLKNNFVPRRGGRLSAYAIHCRFGTLAVFFAHLVKERRLLFNPLAAIDLPRTGLLRRREALTVAEMESLLSQPDLKTATGLRDRAILEVLYATGIRRGELLGLELFDVDVGAHTLRIRTTKYRTERIVPLGTVAARYLTRYLHEVRPRWCANPAEKSLFLNERGIPLCANELHDLVKMYAEISGIQKKVSPHIIRHSCATHMLEGGADLFSIREQLGHRKVETTQLYAHVSPANLKNVHRHCHPRGKKV
jgi:integrase/recombinase XerD